MSQMQIEVINVSSPTFTKTAKGGYNYIEVAYKKDGKVEGKKILDFVNKSVFDDLSVGVKAGDILNVETEKDDRGYWQWTGFKHGEASEDSGKQGASASRPAAASSKSTGGTGRVTGSNYETPAERAARQRLIVRQSSITAAIAIETHNKPKAQIDPNAVMLMADEFVDWVFKSEKTNPETSEE